MIETLSGYAEQAQAVLLEWITSPAAYAQFGLLLAAYFLAVLVTAWSRPRVERLIQPAPKEQISVDSAGELGSGRLST